MILLSAEVALRVIMGAGAGPQHHYAPSLAVCRVAAGSREGAATLFGQEGCKVEQAQDAVEHARAPR